MVYTFTGNGLSVFVDQSCSSRRLCAVSLEDEDSLRLSRAVEASGAGGGGTLVSPRSGRFDWKETLEYHEIKADVPGFKKEEVKVEVIKDDATLLQIRGQRRGGERDEGNDKLHLMERQAGGKFSRRFELPEGALMDQVSVVMDDGVLTVVVPKKEAKKKPEVEQIAVAMKGKKKTD